jgi:predicted O-linked N-acetylglucosamine transferase (SPINDLY family)
MAHARGMPMTQTVRRDLEEALALHQAGRLREALGRYRRILTRQPGNFSARYHQGLARLQLGELEAGAKALEQAVRLAPDHPQARYDLGRAWSQLGRHAQALPHFESLVTLAPDLAEGHFYLGLTLAQLKRPQDALPHLERAAELKPELAEVWHNLGGVLLDLGRPKEAVEAFERAIALQPGLADAHNGLGNALNKLARYKEACDAYKRAIIRKGDFIEAFLGWGTALREMGQFKAARAAYEQALAIAPEDADAHGLLGRVLKDLGSSREAIEHLEKALTAKPDLVDAHCDLAGELYVWGRYEEGRAHFETAMRLAPDATSPLSGLLFSMHYQPDVSAQELAELHRRFGERFETPLRAAWRPHANDRDPERPLRVGFVSGDFRRHPVGYFMVEVMEALDRSHYQPFLYANQGHEDDYTARFKACAHTWREVKGLTDDALAEQIRADGIDILMDLSGHTAGERLMVFARKPAPVQVSYLGYPDTTGLTAMDYLLGDRWTLPEAEVRQRSEQAWWLPETTLCFAPPDLPISVGPLPAIANGHITFGCLNKAEKVNVKVLESWAQILKAVPGSRLLLQSKPYADPQLADQYRARLAARGIDASRVELIGRLSWRDHMETYNRVDIALDPFPYNGTTTSVEGLWMGVPLLTVKGDRLVAHMGETILHNAGLSDWIAADEDDYVAKAVTYAADLEGLAALRAQLRPRLLASPLCDAPRFARHLEQAFRQMWRIWCTDRSTSRPMDLTQMATPTPEA